MKEKLVLWGVLLASGIASLEEYNAFLDDLFLENSEDELLLALEICSQNKKDTVARLLAIEPLDRESFARQLFADLEARYRREDRTLEQWNDMMQRVWKVLPDWQYEDPFYQLSYVGDEAEFRGEKDVREAYERMFRAVRSGEWIANTELFDEQEKLNFWQRLWRKLRR